MEDTYVVKVAHYPGGESVVMWEVTKETAQTIADNYNSQYQTDNYYIEKYDPEKQKGWLGDWRRVGRDIAGTGRSMDAPEGRED